MIQHRTVLVVFFLILLNYGLFRAETDLRCIGASVGQKAGVSLSSCLFCTTVYITVSYKQEFWLVL